MKAFKTLLAVVTLMVAFTVNVNAQSKSKKESKISEVTYSITLHCKDCVKKAEAKIPYIKGLKDVKVSLEEQSVSLKYDNTKTNKETIVKELKKLGYSAKEKCDKKKECKKADKCC